MKNCRDAFDGHTATSGRTGWRDKEGNPVKLPAEAENVFNEYKSVSREKILAKNFKKLFQITKSQRRKKEE